MKKRKTDKQVLAYQPDAVEIEEKPVPGKIRWVLYVILITLVIVVAGASIFSVDRIVQAEGKLITTSPTIVIQPLNTAIIRSIDTRVGDVVKKGQVVATLDSTFAGADLSRLTRQRLSLKVQLRRIRAELSGKPFSAKKNEGEDGILQEHLFRQRKVILDRSRQTFQDKIAALEAKRKLNRVKRRGKEKQLKILRNVEGTTATLPQNGTEYRLRLLDAQKARYRTAADIRNLTAEEEVIGNELNQVRSEWERFIEERAGELMEQQVKLRNELEKINEEIRKAERLHELVSLRAPQEGIVLKMAKRSVGSIIREAEPFITLVPINSNLEARVNVKAKDIARIRINDTARIKIDALPFQRHGTLPGEVRVISEDAFDRTAQPAVDSSNNGKKEPAFYPARIRLLSRKMRNVGEDFRLIPGMKVRAEIRIGKRKVISYFLYPVIRALDESLREP